MGAGALDWLLRPVAAPPGDVALVGRDGTAVELAVLARDGVLVPVVDGLHLAADVAGSTTARAAAMAALVPEHLPVGGVLTMRAALWLHGLVDVCGALDVAVPPPVRGSRRAGVVRVRVRELLVADDEHGPCGDAGLRVASPVRAAADLCRWGVGGPGSRADQVELVVAALALAAGRGLDLAGVDAWLQRAHGHRGVRTGRALLGAAGARRSQRRTASVSCLLPVSR